MTQNQTQQAVKPQLKNLQTKFLFGIDDIPETHVVAVYDRKSNQVTDPNYIFSKLLLKKMLMWLGDKRTTRNLLITGDAGIGKSSIILEFAGRMNRDVYSISCSGKTRFEDFVGSVIITESGATKFVDGPLTRAMREGAVFLANEISRMDAGEQMRFVDVLDERSSLIITQTGEILIPHPDFRFAATGNSMGFGDERGVYPGEKRGSVAFYQRFMKFEIPELTKEQEKNLLLKITPELGEGIISRMLDFAHDIRAVFKGLMDDGKTPAPGGSVLTSNIPNRSVVHWAKLSVEYSKFSEFNAKDASADAAILEALEDSVLNGVPMEEAATFKEIYVKWFGKS